MKQELAKGINSVCNELFGIKIDVELSRPEEKFGDFSSNVSLKLSKELQKPPQEIAEQIAGKLKDNNKFSDVSVAGPGFINIRLSDSALLESMISSNDLEKSLTGKIVVAEYSDPNPFKVLHAGHFYTSVVGDAISNILESAGAQVHRVNYGGDVGLHVAKTMWAVIQNLDGENPAKLAEIEEKERSGWLAKSYVKGTEAHENNDQARQEIIELNKKIYQVSLNKDKDSPLGKIYWETRQWSYDYFDDFYSRIGIKFEKYYPESEVAELGVKTVKENTPKVYTQSDDAVVYKAEEQGLHTRVFITKENLPTYEAKEVGLILQKKLDYSFDKSIIITANEISQYMQVVLASINQFEPELVEKTTHLTHGMVKLPGAEKMSSRKGNFIRAVDILDSAEKFSKEINTKTTPDIVLGAVKYSFLKPSLGGDIIYDAKESVSLEGNSGPYLQYAVVRAKSILAKGSGKDELKQWTELNSSERTLARKISIYPEVFTTALDELSPHHIASYLYELSQTFNRFYENNKVIGDPREALRLGLVKKYAQTLESGLGILGIKIPEKM